jgi:hypothetical protein
VGGRHFVTSSLLAALTLSALPAFAAAPRLDEYAYGLTLEASPGRPLVEAQMPDDVYRHVTRADLGDVRVFNADGNAVPHAFCFASERTAPTVSQQLLPVFALRASSTGSGGSSRIELQTSSGTQVLVEEAGSASTLAAPSVHVIDARGLEGAVRALTFDWESPDGASEATVALQASDDLDRWATLIPATRLLEVSRDGEVLRRARVGLPERSYHYLRVERVDAGPALVVRSATAERVSTGVDIEPLWFIAEMNPVSEPGSLHYDAARRAPVRYARLLLPVDNSAVRVAIESRPDETAMWVQRWRGEVYAILAGEERRVSPPARFDVTSDRYWRIRLLTDVSTAVPPRLELGYRPVRLRFLAHGVGPYTLAFGSRRAEPLAPPGCESLLTDIRADERAQLLSEAYVSGPMRALGGEASLRPAPKQTSVRLIVLWSVLIAGAGVLIAMALVLLKRVGPTGDTLEK